MTLEHAKPGDRIEVTIKGTVGSRSPGHLAIDLGNSDVRMYFSPPDLEHAEVIVKPAMPKWQDGDVVVGFDSAFMQDGAFRRRDGKWFNELLTKPSPEAFSTDSWIETAVDEHGYRVLVAEGQPVMPLGDEGEVPHDFVIGRPIDGDRCTYTDANGTCNMPEPDPIHHGGKP